MPNERKLERVNTTSGFNGDDIVSDASSDMGLSDTDTVFSDDDRGGPGAGALVVGTGVVGVGTGVAIGSSTNAPASPPPPPQS